MARIAGFHPAGPGSIPGPGGHNFLKLFHVFNWIFFSKFDQFYLINWTVSVPNFNISIKLYELLNIFTFY